MKVLQHLQNDGWEIGIMNCNSRGFSLEVYLCKTCIRLEEKELSLQCLFFVGPRLCVGDAKLPKSTDVYGNGSIGFAILNRKMLSFDL